VSRYDHIGRLYDAISLEVLLYRRPRRRLAELFASMPGATVVDVGCGTGLNLTWLRRAVTPGGRVIGVEPSGSMLAAAERRIRRHRWADVSLINRDIDGLAAVLGAGSIMPDAFVATFVLSVVPDEAGFWSTVDAIAATRPLRIGLAELGAAHTSSSLVRPALELLTTLGAGKPDRRPWERLAERDGDAIHETFLGGHVHVTVGSVRPGDR
jgi:S-adenosylmethionine-diacylgycerolhomoserine-N-methlytransferase